MFCSPILPFCLRTGEQEPFIQPIWSILVYMLLVETLEVDDRTLREKLSVVVPPENILIDLGSEIDTQGCRCSGRLRRLTERDQSQSSSGALTEDLRLIHGVCVE